MAPVTIAAEATIADGIAVRRAGDVTLPSSSRFMSMKLSPWMMKRSPSAILMLLEQEKTLAEGAGAAALAAVVQSKNEISGAICRTVVLVCGGNIDVSLLAKIIERGLVKDGRLSCVRVYLQEPSRRPACTSLSILVDERANIVETIHNRAYYGVSLGETVDVTLETRGATHITAISHALFAKQAALNESSRNTARAESNMSTSRDLPDAAASRLTFRVFCRFTVAHDRG